MARELSYYTANGGGSRTIVPEVLGKLKYNTGGSTPTWTNVRLVREYTGDTGWVTVWKVEDEPDPPDPGGGGTYVIYPSSIALGTQQGYAEFNTSAYQGRITAVSVQITWLASSFNISTSLTVMGRPNLRTYRTINNDNGEYNGRTITHGISSYNSSAVSDFNSGAATGFNFDAGVFTLNNMISYAKLVLTTSS